MATALLLEPHVMVSITASDTAEGYDAANVAIDRMGLVWRTSTGSTARSLTVDLGEDKALDTILLLGLFGADDDWAWSIDLATAAQGGFSGAYWAGSAETLLAGSVMPVGGLGKALWRAPSDAPEIARYVRINFPSHGSAAVEVSRVVISPAIQLGRNFKFGAALGVRPMGKVDFSIRGVPLPRRGKKLRGVGISFGHIYRDEVEQRTAPLMERVGNDTAISIVLDPAPHSQRQNRIYHGWLTGNLGHIWARAGGFGADFNLVAID